MGEIYRPAMALEHRRRGVPGERLYVIRSFTFDMAAVYTKGKLVKEGRELVFYVLVSSKLDVEP